MNDNIPVDYQWIENYQSDEEQEYEAMLEDMRLDMEVDAYMDRQLED